MLNFRRTSATQRGFPRLIDTMEEDREKAASLRKWKYAWRNIKPTKQKKIYEPLHYKKASGEEIEMICKTFGLETTKKLTAVTLAYFPKMW